jgi:hypothetical protein
MKLTKLHFHVGQQLSKLAGPTYQPRFQPKGKPCASDTIAYRNKLIAMADSLDWVWELVNQYETPSIASDNDDAIRIKKAEISACPAIRSQQRWGKKNRGVAEVSTTNTIEILFLFTIILTYKNTPDTSCSRLLRTSC